MSEQNHLDVRGHGLEAEVHGLPSLNLDTVMGTSLPNEFEFETVFGDILMCEVIDENEHGEVNRNGIWVKLDITQKLWRRGRVVLKGPKCVGVEVGDELAYPGDRGLPFISANKTKYVFLSLERVFGKLKPLKTDSGPKSETK